MSMSQDEYLIVGTNGKSVYVYKHNETQFNFIQKFTYSKSNNKMVSITDDHLRLTVSDQGSNKIF